MLAGWLDKRTSRHKAAPQIRKRCLKIHNKTKTNKTKTEERRKKHGTVKQ